LILKVLNFILILVYFFSLKVGKFCSIFLGAYFFRNGGKLCPEMMCYIPYIARTFKGPLKVLRGPSKLLEQIHQNLKTRLTNTEVLSNRSWDTSESTPRTPSGDRLRSIKSQNSTFRTKSFENFSDFDREKKKYFICKKVFFF